MHDDDDAKALSGILGHLGPQSGGLFSGLFPPPGNGGMPADVDPTALSLAAAAGAADLARTLRAINHQAAIMAAFGKAVGAPGAAGAASLAPAPGPQPPVPPAPADASPSSPMVPDDAPAPAMPAATVNASATRAPPLVPLPLPYPPTPVRRARPNHDKT